MAGKSTESKSARLTDSRDAGAASSAAAFNPMIKKLLHEAHELASQGRPKLAMQKCKQAGSLAKHGVEIQRVSEEAARVTRMRGALDAADKQLELRFPAGTLSNAGSCGLLLNPLHCLQIRPHYRSRLVTSRDHARVSW